ncbi:MAG: hypothetical protein IJX30_04240 [Clostridia bacterium]|nr:hypothetical protein [Clostridia bacterium]
MANIKTITLYEYNDNRQLIKKIESKYKALDEVENETIYEYTDNGYLKQRIWYKHKNGIRILRQTYVYEYNDIGQKVKLVVFDETETISTVYVSKYNKQGKIVQHTHQTPRGVVLSTTKTTYTKKGFNERNYKSNGDFEDDAIVVYECDEKGNIILQTYYDKYQCKTFWTEYYYDGLGNLIRDISYESDGSIAFERKYEYQDDLLIKEYMY